MIFYLRIDGVDKVLRFAIGTLFYIFHIFGRHFDCESNKKCHKVFLPAIRKIGMNELAFICPNKWT
jgi:hypothetical protein